MLVAAWAFCEAPNAPYQRFQPACWDAPGCAAQVADGRGFWPPFVAAAVTFAEGPAVWNGPAAWTPAEGPGRPAAACADGAGLYKLTPAERSSLIRTTILD